MPATELLTLQLAPDTARHFATGEVSYEGTRHQEHLIAACRRADRGQRANINAPLWDLQIERRTIEALLANPNQDRSSHFHHELVRACQTEAKADAGINDNPPCQLCNCAYSDQFFMEGFWAHESCLDRYYDLGLQGPTYV